VEIRELPLADLIPASYNPRRDLQLGDAEYDRLKRSIENFGYVEPIIWNERSGNVVGGHQRLKVLLELGHAEESVVVVDLPDAEEKALNLALNKISGEWDEAKLYELLQSLEDVTLTGFSEREVEKIFADFGHESGADDDFDLDTALENIADPVTHTGDRIQLGGHVLLCGDAANPDDYTRLMGGDALKYDLLLTDPPYNVDYEGRAGKIQNDNLTCTEFQDFLFRAFREASDYVCPGSAFYVFHADGNSGVFHNAVSAAGLDIKQSLVWVKNQFTLGRQDYQWQHEPILYGWKSGGKHYFTGSRKKSTVIDDAPTLADCELMDKEQMFKLIWKLLEKRAAVASTVLRYDKPTKSAEHPTMKPIALLAELISNSSKPGQTVLDPFGGSGSTLIACEQTGRVCRTMELDPRYCDVIVSRWETLTGGKAERLSK
jgi:DNA modification methylase